MKRFVSVILVSVLLLSLFTSCSNKKLEKFTESYIDYFDTVATITGYCNSSEEFDEISSDIEHMLKEYHELFDIYNTYSGVNNLATINKKAGEEPVSVDDRIIVFLNFAKEIYELTKGETDVTYGSVLKLWHDSRTYGINNPEEAALPRESELITASCLHGFENIEINRENNTVYITKKGLSLDVGAIAKGYAVEKIALQLEARGITGFALNIGGNIRVVGNKPNDEKWTAAIKDPFGDGYLMNVYLDKKSFVTSGSYQRFFTVDGKNYHHIIDFDTLYPSEYFASVSVMANDSTVADGLSTALFTMPLEDGKLLIESLPDTEAVWVDNSGEIFYSSGFLDSVYRSEE